MWSLGGVKHMFKCKEFEVLGRSEKLLKTLDRGICFPAEASFRLAESMLGTERKSTVGGLAGGCKAMNRG
jgi:hypothetical protein